MSPFPLGTNIRTSEQDPDVFVGREGWPAGYSRRCRDDSVGAVGMVHRMSSGLKTELAIWKTSFPSRTMAEQQMLRTVTVG